MKKVKRQNKIKSPVFIMKIRKIIKKNPQKFLYDFLLLNSFKFCLFPLFSRQLSLLPLPLSPFLSLSNALSLSFSLSLSHSLSLSLTHSLSLPLTLSQTHSLSFLLSVSLSPSLYLSLSLSHTHFLFASVSTSVCSIILTPFIFHLSFLLLDVV